MPEIRVQACLNGSRRAGEHPALPLTAQELAHDAQRVIAAGATSLHIHPRDAEGEQSLLSSDIGAALTAIRGERRRVAVGVSTASWIEPDVARRLQLVQAWSVLPDFVSVNFSEEGIEDLCTHFFALGVGVEAGLASIEDAQRFLDFGLTNFFLRILIEIDGQESERALAQAEAIIRCLDDASNVHVPRLLHGENTTVWPLLTLVRRYGYETRIGLEDTLALPDGSQARDNAELVSTLLAILDRP